MNAQRKPPTVRNGMKKGSGPLSAQMLPPMPNSCGPDALLNTSLPFGNGESQFKPPVMNNQTPMSGSQQFPNRRLAPPPGVGSKPLSPPRIRPPPPVGGLPPFGSQIMDSSPHNGLNPQFSSQGVGSSMSSESHHITQGLETYVPNRKPTSEIPPVIELPPVSQTINIPPSNTDWRSFKLEAIKPPENEEFFNSIKDDFEISTLLKQLQKMEAV